MEHLNLEQRLNGGEEVVSPNRQYRLTQQHDGNLVLYDGPSDDNAIWHTNTAGYDGNYAILQADGNFVVYDQNDNPLWAAASNRDDFRGVLVVTDGGKIHILDAVADVTDVPAVS